MIPSNYSLTMQETEFTYQSCTTNNLGTDKSVYWQR